MVDVKHGPLALVAYILEVTLIPLQALDEFLFGAPQEAEDNVAIWTDGNW